MNGNLDIELMWSYVCSGEIEKAENYYKQGWEKNTRYRAFGENHSLIAGAYRNKQFEMVDYSKPESHITLKRLVRNSNKTSILLRKRCKMKI